MNARRMIVALLVAVVGVVPLMAQRGGGGFGFGRRTYLRPNLPYDGRFNVVRIRYLSGGSWSADYPTMEENFSTILKELTTMAVHTDGSNVHTLDDQELTKFPVAYLTEPGYWVPNDAEVEGLRTWLAKGGFLIVDDFHFANEWNVFENAMRRVLPDAVIHPLDLRHPIFNSFFAIKSLRVPYPGRLGEQGLYGEFYGIYDKNDTNSRLSVVINYNMDIGDYMEWSATNSYNPLPTNEAYKFMINYVVYGLTH